MKTRVYIDGYNLYFGCLKHTPYKWLDLRQMIENLITRSGLPNAVLADIDPIKYITAEINPKAAADINSLNDQLSYHKALYLYSPEVKIIKGSYSIERNRYPLVQLDKHQKELEPRKCERALVWKIEEKQSDVNVALEAVYDSIIDETLEQVIFVSNDTDLIPALLKIRYYNQQKKRSPIKIGLIVPSREQEHKRYPNSSLSELADWTIKYIKNEELAMAQMPCRISGKRNAAIKPTSWFEHANKIQEILDILANADILRSEPRAWRWLSEPKPRVEGLPILETSPDKMLDSLEGIEIVKQHALAFAEFRKKLE